MDTRSRRWIFSILFTLLAVAAAMALFAAFGARHSKTYANAQMVQMGQVA